MAVLKLEHTGIMVNDMDESIRFYESVLGLEVKGMVQHNDPSIMLGFLGFKGDDGHVVELISKPNNDFPSEGRVHHLAFTVDDVAKEADRIRGLGVKFLADSITTLKNGAQYIFFEGPNGEQLELFQPGE